MERRAIERGTYMSRTEIAWQDGNRELKTPAVIENRSSFGLGSPSSQPIPEGSAFQLAYQGRMVQGVIRYCARQPHGFLIGFSFEREQSDGIEREVAADGAAR